MGKYTGIPCSHCSHPFTEEDDVVVCPDCGAPHHRSCFRELGHCALAEKHSPEFAWNFQSSTPEQAHNSTAATCSRCGAATPAELPNCQMCGAALVPATDAPTQTMHGQYHRQSAPQNEGYFDDWELNGVSARELSAYSGSAAYYFLNQSKRLTNSWGNISWNWCAFFFGFLYFFYRKMYRAGTALLAFYVLTSLPTMLSFVVGPLDTQVTMYGLQLSYNAQLFEKLIFLNQAMGFFQWGLMIVCGLFANKLYLQAALAKITAYREGRKTDAQYFADLYLLGSPNPLVVVLISVALFLGSALLGTLMKITPMV